MRRRLLWNLTAAEAKAFLREPVAVFFTFAFPMLLVAIIGSVYGRTPYGEGAENPFPGLRTIDVFVPSMFGLGAANLGLMGLPSVFAGYRERGVLRTYRVTPLPFRTFFAAHALVQLAMLVGISALITLSVVAFWGLRFDGDTLLMTAAFLAAALSMFSLGFVVGGLVRTARQAQAVGAAIFFPGLFLSGATFPVDVFPSGLRFVAEINPMTPMIKVLDYTWAGKAASSYAVAYVVLFLFTAAALVLARRSFRWE